MKCEEFHERLNDCLDAGRQPGRDRRLRQHTVGCRACRSDLLVWQRVADSLRPQRTPTRPPSWRIGFPVALAAALGFVLLGDWSPPMEKGAVADGRRAVEVPASAETPPLPAVPSQWRDPEWIDRWADRVAEPLGPLSQGFAPLGRSFQTAFTLLVLPAEGRKAEVQPFAPPLQSKVFAERAEVSYA